MSEHAPLYTPLTSSTDEIKIYPKRFNSPLWNFLKLVGVILAFLLFVGLVIMIIALVNHRNYKNKKLNLNIHLKLSVQCETFAKQMNANITAHDANQMIDFVKKQEPHITLYLTYFDNKHVKNIEKALIELVNSNTTFSGVPCFIDMEPHVEVSGNYIMWQVKKDACIQRLSDLIVNHTSAYVNKQAKSTIPDWVNSLPPALRDLKIDMIRKYGSPNVFTQFDPHVTLAWSSTNTTILNQIVNDYVSDRVCTYQAFKIGVGTTGPYGTVLRGEDVFDINILNQKQVALEKLTESLLLDQELDNDEY